MLVRLKPYRLPRRFFSQEDDQRLAIRDIAGLSDDDLAAERQRVILARPFVQPDALMIGSDDQPLTVAAWLLRRERVIDAELRRRAVGWPGWS